MLTKPLFLMILVGAAAFGTCASSLHNRLWLLAGTTFMIALCDILMLISFMFEI